MILARNQEGKKISLRPVDLRQPEVWKEEYTGSGHATSGVAMV